MVKSAPGEGASSPCTCRPLAPNRSPAPTRGRRKLRDTRERILLVEDEPGLVLTLSDRLAREGYAIETSGDGESALERATTEGFDPCCST